MWPLCFFSEKSWLDCAGCCESSSTQSLTVAHLPLILSRSRSTFAELHFGATSSLLLLSRSCVEALWPLSLVRTWCSLSIVWTYSLSPLSLVRTWCSLSTVWTYSLSPWSLVRTGALCPWYGPTGFRLVLSKDLVLFVHSLDLQPFALSLVRTWCFVHSMDLQPFALVLSKDLMLCPYYGPTAFRLVLSQDLVLCP